MVWQKILGLVDYCSTIHVLSSDRGHTLKMISDKIDDTLDTRITYGLFKWMEYHALWGKVYFFISWGKTKWHKTFRPLFMYATKIWNWKYLWKWLFFGAMAFKSICRKVGASSKLHPPPPVLTMASFVKSYITARSHIDCLCGCGGGGKKKRRFCSKRIRQMIHSGHIYAPLQLVRAAQSWSPQPAYGEVGMVLLFHEQQRRCSSLRRRPSSPSCHRPIFCCASALYLIISYLVPRITHPT